jgi:hypothetical protein
MAFDSDASEYEDGTFGAGGGGGTKKKKGRGGGGGAEKGGGGKGKQRKKPAARKAGSGVKKTQARGKKKAPKTKDASKRK